MSKVVIEVDTELKTVDVKIDGSVVENVNSVYLYNMPEYHNHDCCDFHIEVSTYEKSGDMRKRTTLSASELAQKELNDGLATASKYKGFVEKQDNPDLEKSVASMLDSCRRR